MLATLAAIALLANGCGVAGRAIQRDMTAERRSTPAPIDRTLSCDAQRVDVLDCDERLWAEAAWKYVENNTNGNGVVNGTDKRPVVSMWDVADAIAATYAARELGLIDTCAFDARFGRLVGFLNTMPLVDDLAPNRWYNASNATMVDAENKPALLGWSAMDLGRLLLWLRIVEARHPIWSEYIGRAVARWNYCAIVDACGTLNRGVHTGPDTNTLEQEGRLGYEEYAAAGFALWGFDTARAAAVDPSEPVDVEGIELRRDSRPSAAPGNIAALTTTPFAAYEMELGALGERRDGPRYRQLGRDVARAQYERYRRTKTMTARTHRPMATAPWRVYDSVYADGYAWNPVDLNGKVTPYFALFSTAAAFELWAAYPDEAADRFLEFACAFRDPQRGWYSGRFERTGGTDDTLSLRTNAAVLEALLYRKFGPIYRPAAEPGWFDVNVRDEFFRPGRCLPGEERRCGEDCPPLRQAPRPGSPPAKGAAK
jgi:hypothetical protein